MTSQHDNQATPTPTRPGTTSELPTATELGVQAADAALRLAVAELLTCQRQRARIEGESSFGNGYTAEWEQREALAWVELQIAFEQTRAPAAVQPASLLEAMAVRMALLNALWHACSRPGYACAACHRIATSTVAVAVGDVLGITPAGQRVAA